MLEVKFYDSVDDTLLKFAVIISKTDGKWVFCKHKERDTFISRQVIVGFQQQRRRQKEE